MEGVIDNVRSVWNVGSIFRSADGFGLKHLYLCGITPTPGSEAMRKTSLGSEKTVAWSYHKNAVLLLQDLREQEYKLFALERHIRAIPIKDILLARRRRSGDPAKKSAFQRRITPKDKIALIVGNEITGVDPDVLDMCDEIVFIPMRGNKKSFNAAVAFAVAVSQLAL
jgi:tRNA G18 (ribose-2'-O)-methylase SpoU